jgi:hypothetical protein
MTGEALARVLSAVATACEGEGAGRSDLTNEEVAAIARLALALDSAAADAQAKGSAAVALAYTFEVQELEMVDGKRRTSARSGRTPREEVNDG